MFKFGNVLAGRVVWTTEYESYLKINKLSEYRKVPLHLSNQCTSLATEVFN